MTECPSCHTVPPTPHTDFCLSPARCNGDHNWGWDEGTGTDRCTRCHTPAPTTPEPWLGHWNSCSSQYSPICDCDPDNPVNLAEQRPEDDPPDPVICDGRNCGGVPHG